MSKIEKALKKAQKESEKKAEKAPTSTPDKRSHADLSEQNTPDKQTAKRESRIMSAMGKSKNGNKTELDSKFELNVRNVPKSEERLVVPAQDVSSEAQDKEGAFPTTTIDTFNVNKRIVSYYCAIDKPTWIGPVMVYFRRLQLSFANMRKHSDCRAMLFTSSCGDEGKSTVSINTAISLCSDQKSRVALVDCDFRAPSVDRILGFTAEKGLADYLSEETGIEEIGFDGLVPGLTIIPAGSKQTNIHELLDSERMNALIPYLKKRFDYVVIDSPPVLVFPDTSILAHMVDGVALVINGENSNKKNTKRAVEILKDCRIVGFVMNMGENAAAEHYGYSSGYASS